MSSQYIVQAVANRITHTNNVTIGNQEEEMKMIFITQEAAKQMYLAILALLKIGNSRDKGDLNNLIILKELLSKIKT